MSTKCDYRGPSGKRCKNWAVTGDTRCNLHGGKVKGERPRAERCSAVSASGEPCQQMAVIGSDPPLCVAHSGLREAVRGPNNGAWRHGFYSKGETDSNLEGMIEDLFERQSQVSTMLDVVGDVGELLRLLSMHFKNAAVIGKLLRDKKALEGKDDDLLSALGPALDLLEARMERG